MALVERSNNGQTLTMVDELLKPEFEKACRIGLRVPPGQFLSDDVLKAFPIAWGWYQKLRRTAEAAVILEAAGYSNEMSPLLRLQVEFASAIHWLAEDKDGAAERVHKMAKEDTHKRLNSARLAGLKIDEAKFAEVLANEISEENRHLDRYLRAAHRLQREGLASPHHLVLYHSETQYSHPTYDAAAEFLLEEREGDSWHPLAEPKMPHSLSAYTVGTEFVLLGAMGLSQIMDGNPWEGEIVALIRSSETKLVAAAQQ